MEKIIQKLLVLTGVFIGAAVALTPITTYADSSNCRPAGSPADPDEVIDVSDPNNIDFVENGNQGNTNVCIYVDTVLSLDAADGGDKITMFPDMIRTGEFHVQVRSAMPYTISLSAEEPELKHVDTESYFIPARSEITAGKVGWGIRKASQTEGYTAVATVPQVFFDSEVDDNGTGTHVADVSTLHTFEIGVSITDKVPQGIYETEVTVTAAVKE